MAAFNRDGKPDAMVDDGDDYGSSKPGRCNAWRSKVKVRAQPALVPSAPINASAKDPSPLLSATMAVNTFLLILDHEDIDLKHALYGGGDFLG